MVCTGHRLQCKPLMVYLHNNTRSRRRTTTMRSNDTLVDTPFQLISGFFHVNKGVLCCAGVCWRGGGATGLLNKGGGSNRLPGLVNNKLWNFHRY